MVNGNAALLTRTKSIFVEIKERGVMVSNIYSSGFLRNLTEKLNISMLMACGCGWFIGMIALWEKEDQAMTPGEIMW